MRKRSALLGVVTVALLGCGGGDDDEGERERARTEPARTIEAPGPAVNDLPGTEGQSAGAQVALTSGCLGCHRLGSAGNAGPGGDLSRIGAKLPARAIDRALLRPDPPMPSYESLPPDMRRDLVRYLASLR